MKKVFIAASLIAFMGTAAFAQQPATQSKKDTQQTHQVEHKHHAKTTNKKTSSKKQHHHASKTKKADSTSVKAK